MCQPVRRIPSGAVGRLVTVSTVKVPDRNVQEARIELWLVEDLLVEAFSGDRGAFGADLLWVFRRD